MGVGMAASGGTPKNVLLVDFEAIRSEGNKQLEVQASYDAARIKHYEVMLERVSADIAKLLPDPLPPKKESPDEADEEPPSEAPPLPPKEQELPIVAALRRKEELVKKRNKVKEGYDNKLAQCKQPAVRSPRLLEMIFQELEAAGIRCIITSEHVGFDSEEHKENKAPEGGSQERKSIEECIKKAGLYRYLHFDEGEAKTQQEVLRVDNLGIKAKGNGIWIELMEILDVSDLRKNRVSRVIDVLRVTAEIKLYLQKKPPDLRAVYEVFKKERATIEFASTESMKWSSDYSTCHTDMVILNKLWFDVLPLCKPFEPPPIPNMWQRLGAWLSRSKNYADMKQEYDKNIQSYYANPPPDVCTQITASLAAADSLDSKSPKRHAHHSTNASLARTHHLSPSPAPTVSSSSPHDKEEKKKAGQKVAAMEIESAPLNQKPTSKLEQTKRLFGFK